MGGEVKPQGAADRLMAPVLARVLGRRLEGAFANIKRVLEGEDDLSVDTEAP